MAAVDTTKVFKDNIFAGKVLLCSGGGSGICRGMTEAMVRHGAKAVIISRTYANGVACLYNPWCSFATIVILNSKRQLKK